MSRIIAIWGCPDSGKTTFTVKLAKAIHAEYGSKVICIFADSATPTLPVLFPNMKSSELFSVGDVLSRTEITQTTILKHLVTISDAKEIGFLGFNGGENRHSHPEFSADKAAALYDTAASIADFVIVDCGNKLTGTLGFTAISKADSIIRLCKPDLKSISFFDSQAPLYTDVKFRTDEHITVMNVTEHEAYMPIEEAAQHFKCEKFVIPYAPELGRQAMNGLYFDKVTSKAWNKEMRKIMFMAVGA